MPPTTSEISAMAETSSVMVAVVFSTVCRMLSEFMVKKSCLPWRCVSIWVMPDSAAALSASSRTRTVMERRWLVPIRRPITVV